MHLVCRNKLLVLFTIRCEAYSSMEEDLQIRPYLIQILGSRFFQYAVQHPNQVHQRTDILNQDGRQIAHQAILHVIVRTMASSQYQALSRKETAFRIFTKIQCNRIYSSSIMNLLQSVGTDRNKLTFIISCSRWFGIPDDLPWPKHISFTVTHTVHISLHILVRLYRNTLKIRIILDMIIIIPHTPLCSGSFMYQFSEYTSLNFFGLCPIKVDFLLSGDKYFSY